MTLGGDRGGRFRSPAARALLAAALTVSLVLGGAFLAVSRLHSSPNDSIDHPAHPATDEQTKAEVVEQAKQIVAIGRLQQTSVGYMLMSCKDRDDPPYQGAVYMNFALPPDTHAYTYFRTIAAALVGRGWHEGLPPNQHVHGKTLYNDGVTAIIYQNDDYPKLGIARLYGQCRNMTNHRSDTLGWTDITDQFQPTR